MSNVTEYNLSNLPTADVVKVWSKDDVKEFLQRNRTDLELEENDVNVIYDQNVTGKAFLRLKEEQLTRDPGPFKLLFEPASAIAEVVKQISGEQPVAGKRSHSLSFSELETQNLKRNKISFDSLLELRQHISVDKLPIVFIPFVPRPNIQNQICGEIYTSTLLVYTSNRLQDYRGIVISGGSGVGKTRLGFEIENFIVNNEQIQTQINSLKITFKHIFIRMNEIIYLLGEEQKTIPNTNKYPRISEDIDKAEEVLTMLIAMYFFAEIWTLTSIKQCKKLIPKIMEYSEIVNLIRKEMKLDQDALLVLILQIDEFQISPYWTVTLLRVISRIVDTNKTLIVSVCTGTAPSRISDLSNNESSIISASQYQTININLSPMSFNESKKIFDFFIDHYNDRNDILSDKNNIYHSIVNAIRGIPVIIELAVKVIVDQKLNLFESYDIAGKFWEFLRLSVERRYSKQNWLQSLGDDNNVILLLYFIHTQSVLSKQEKFLDSGFTIEDFEAGGLIYLEQYNGNYFIPRAPLILISVLVDYFDLSGIFDKLLLNPFNLLTEDTFPQFVLRMHQATYGLAFCLGITTISFTEIYGGYGFCSDDFRDCEIEVKQVEYYDHPSLIPKKEGQYDDFISPGLKNRKRFPVVCSNNKGYKHIDVTSGEYLILIARRTKSADALTPHGDEQYKFSLALESGQPVHTDSTGEIDIDLLVKEEKKAKDTGCERFILVSPKTFKMEDRSEIPENCAVVAGSDLINFIGPYALVIPHLTLS